MRLLKCSPTQRREGGTINLVMLEWRDRLARATLILATSLVIFSGIFLEEVAVEAEVESQRELTFVITWNLSLIHISEPTRQEAIKGDDLSEIEAKTKELTEASTGLASKMYSEQQAQAGEATAEGAADDAAGGSPENDAVDAEFEEVKDDK